MTLRKRLIGVSATLLVVYFLILVGLGGSSLFSFGRGPATEPASAAALSEAMAAGTIEKFNYLSDQQSSTCSLQPEAVQMFPQGQRIQGACCTSMDLHRYQEQVKGLRQYSNLSQIPEDPYDIPVSLAKELFAYQQNIALTAEQQTVYDQAMEMSAEGGPCCCKCWRWDAFEGQAKYLIAQLQWDSEQIAELWDLEDGCGGEGHEHA